jgi:hypothetical protein
MPRFVILEHDYLIVHWDLMLEANAALQTWRLAQPPYAGAGSIVATLLGDHRVAYLDYEGPVSGNRGTVKRWDGGTFTELAESSIEARVFDFQGVMVRGRARLRRIAGSDWQFEWVND